MPTQGLPLSSQRWAILIRPHPLVPRRRRSREGGIECAFSRRRNLPAVQAAKPRREGHGHRYDRLYRRPTGAGLIFSHFRSIPAAQAAKPRREVDGHCCDRLYRLSTRLVFSHFRSLPAVEAAKPRREAHSHGYDRLYRRPTGAGLIFSLVRVVSQPREG